MEINVTDIVIHLINIVVLYLLLRTILYKPVSRFLSERSERIAAQLEKARLAEQDALDQKNAYEKRLLEAQSEIEAMREESAKQANEAASALLEDIRSQADQMLVEARDKVEHERGEAFKSLQGQIADMALSLASQILKREVSESDNREIIYTFFNKAG